VRNLCGGTAVALGNAVTPGDDAPTLSGPGSDSAPFAARRSAKGPYPISREES